MEACHRAVRNVRGVLVDGDAATATALRRTGVPPPVVAVLLGGAVVVLDSRLADLGEEREAAAAAESDVAAESAEG